MEVNTTPNPARGEVAIILGGQPLTLRFNLRTLHDFTSTSGLKLTDLGPALTDDTFGTVGGLVASAVRCATNKPFSVGDALDVLDSLSESENQAVIAAVVEAIRVDRSPLFKALIAQLPQQSAPEPNGASTLSLA